MLPTPFLQLTKAHWREASCPHGTSIILFYGVTMKKTIAPMATPLEKEIRAAVDELAQLRNAILATQLAMEAEIEAAITPEIKARISAVRDRYAKPIETATNALNRKEAELVKKVLKHGATVKAGLGTAMYQKPKVTWDGKALLEYASTENYAVLRFRKHGKPSARIIYNPPPKKKGAP
jgi:hypothetical protein